jgi:hypothetical protein
MASIQDAVVEREVYTPPRVVKMSDLNPGHGQIGTCGPAGSGESGFCKVGNSAGTGCYAGNGAIPD